MLRFSDSEVRRFYQSVRTSQYAGQRLGQAFCSHFKLHMSVPGKTLEDRLYELDSNAARAVIAEHTDYDN